MKNRCGADALVCGRPLRLRSTPCRAALLALLLAAPAFAQFALYVVDGNVEHPAPAVLDLGAVYPGEAASARFRLRNISASPAALGFLQANGVGYALTGAPTLPVGLQPQQAIDFAVVFQTSRVGSYSASLDTVGASVLLTTAVLPRVSCQVSTPAGYQTLDTAPVAFGAVEVGSPATRHFLLDNLTGEVMPAPAVSVQGAGFAMSGLPPGGALLQPLDTAAFDVIFLPATAGALTGSLTVGDRTYALTGISSPLPLPHPLLSIDVPKAASGQQGTVTIQFDSAARVAGDGTLTLDFQPLAKGAGDPAIQLGVVGRAASFAFAAGDTQAAFGDLAAVAFQTGTTAGTLTFTADIGGVTEQKTITIDPAPVTMFSAAGTRGSGSIELRIAGFDNTRSAGAVQYTFFDAAGNAIPPGAIVMDSTAIFAAYFGASDAGGQFELLSVFPVTGDASRIAAFEVEIANSAGKTGSGRQKL